MNASIYLTLVEGELKITHSSSVFISKYRLKYLARPGLVPVFIL
jgi:hypothetical protein